MLKNLFWSKAELVRQYMNHEAAGSGSDDDGTSDNETTNNVCSVCLYEFEFCVYECPADCMMCMCVSACLCRDV